MEFSRIVKLNVKRLVTMVENVPEQRQRYGRRAVLEAALEPGEKHLAKFGNSMVCHGCGTLNRPAQTVTQYIRPPVALSDREKAKLNRLRRKDRTINGLRVVECKPCGYREQTGASVTKSVARKLSKRRHRGQQQRNVVVATSPRATSPHVASPHAAVPPPPPPVPISEYLHKDAALLTLVGHSTPPPAQHELSPAHNLSPLAPPRDREDDTLFRISLTPGAELAPPTPIPPKVRRKPRRLEQCAEKPSNKRLRFFDR